MKKYILILAILLTGVGGMAQYRQATLQASGLTCALCSNAINQALSELGFIDNVDTDLENATFSIRFKTGADVSFDAIRLAVEDAGFSVAQLKVLVDMPATRIKKDTHLSLGGLNLHFLDVKEQELSGDKWLLVVDKNFITSAAYKKFSKTTAMACYATGTMGSCCSVKKNASSRIYHVTL